MRRISTGPVADRSSTTGLHMALLTQITTTPRRRTTGLIAVAGLAATLALAPAAQAKTVTVTKARSGKSIVLEKGDKLVVKLDENPSTGYAWKTLARPAFLKLISSKYVAPESDPSAPPIVGAGGTRISTYSAKTKGKGTLRLSYVPPGSGASGSFLLTITVK
jgi:inhibitor of cysteine peptidase